ncbi:gag/pol protein [Cucumis melo var. makuwa]|uniref:Gag/pol protein n=1 Tax=Cucumis melo var. makuwa TaxID=1194695 RepID=A0A5D3DQR1_CUCMM|nr:gag/pol protein [Cucumis melo var. makuwa]
MPRCSEKIVSQPNHYLGLIETQVVILVDGVEDPLSYKQAMNDVDKDQCVKVMDLEMESMYLNLVWELVDLSEGVKPIGCKWIYKRKRDSTGKVQALKARLVAKREYLDVSFRGVHNPRSGAKSLTRDCMLMYVAKDLILTGYTDFDFQTDKDYRKFTSGSVFTLNGGAVV